jgi:putative ABC transport system permease protein
LSYDKSFFSASDTYRVEGVLQSPDGNLDESSSIGWPIGKALATHFPEIEKISYVRNARPIINHNDAYFNENALMADNAFIDVVGLPLLQGNPNGALEQPFSIAISESSAKKYFGNVSPLGKTMFIQDTIPYTVTAVFRDIPLNSHLRFDMLLSFSSACAEDPAFCDEQFATGWFNMNVYNYVKLNNTATPEKFNSKIRDIVQLYGKSEVEKYGYKCYLNLRPFSDIYLHSNMPTGFGEVGSYKMVKLYIGIALFVLLIASFNFINLTTVRSMDRARVIGVQKVLGNIRRRLIAQFLTETGLLCVFSFGISLVLMFFLLPTFNEITGKTLTLPILFSSGNLLLMLGVLILLIPLAGFYPALVLSAYEPIQVLKGKFSRSVSGNFLRKVLVTFQILLSI